MAIMRKANGSMVTKKDSSNSLTPIIKEVLSGITRKENIDTKKNKLRKRAFGQPYLENEHYLLLP
jgi:hypothetical protein